MKLISLSPLAAFAAGAILNTSALAGNTSDDFYPVVRTFGHSHPTVVLVHKPATTVGVFISGSASKTKRPTARQSKVQRQSDPHGGLRVLYVGTESAQ